MTTETTTSPTTKRFHNEPEDLVTESVRRLQRVHPALEVSSDLLHVRRAALAVLTPGKVAPVSGGGTGYEPVHFGHAGAGMLDAVVPGVIRVSPTAIQVMAASRSVETGAGDVVKKYTGDVLNLRVAAELCAGAGVEVERVPVDHEVARDSGDSGSGRRAAESAGVLRRIL